MKTPVQLFNGWRAAVNTRREREAIALLGLTNVHQIRNAPRRERRAVQRACVTLQKNYSHYVRNFYESGNPYSDGSRSNVGQYSSDARYDQNPVARRTMEMRTRHWEQNSPIMKSALDVGGQYSIGTHLPVVTSLAERSAGNPTWAENAEKVFCELCEQGGLDGESMFAMLDVGRRRKTVDGNILFVETSRAAKVTIRRGTKHETQIDVMRPCYQLVESHRIGSPWASWSSNSSNENIRDGVQFAEIETKLSNGTARRQMVRTGYWVNNGFSDQFNTGTPVFIPVQNCYYASSAHRADEPRGVSDFYAAEPTLALLEDLLKLEMRAQEVQSDIALFITNGAGQVLDPKMQGTMAALGIKVSTGQDGKPVVTTSEMEKVKATYEKIWGGRTAVGRTGDTMATVAPTRPAEATLNLWNFLIDSFCAGSNVPRMLVFPKFSKGQGTEVRAEIERANAAWIKEFNLVWKPLIHRIWKFFMGWAIKNDERVKNPPSDWEHIEVSPPRSVVVDLGYVSANALAEMAAGVYPLHNWAQDHGTTKQRIIKNSVADLFDIKLACLEFAQNPAYAGITVTADEVRNNLAEVVKARAALETAEAAKITAENPDLQPA